MSNEIKITVIATGFEVLGNKAPTQASRQTVPGYTLGETVSPSVNVKTVPNMPKLDPPPPPPAPEPSMALPPATSEAMSAGLSERARRQAALNQKVEQTNGS